MRIQTANAEALAIAGENEANAKVASSQADLSVKRAEAFERAEVRKKQAEAQVLEQQNVAMAKAALAEAERVEAEQRAKLEAPAKAQKARAIVDAEAAAETRRLQAEAEANATYLRLAAEAKGQYEILAKKGEGLKQIIAACGGAKEAFQIMLLEHLDNLAEASAKAMSNIKFDKVVVWENGGTNGRSNVGDFISGMARTMPPMLQVMKDIGGIELPDALVKLTDEPTKPSEPSANGAGEPKAPLPR
jgi:flotillin